MNGRPMKGMPMGKKMMAGGYGGKKGSSRKPAVSRKPSR